MVLTLLTIDLGGISVALPASQGGPVVAGIQVRVLGVLGWATAVFATLPLLQILLAVIRSEREFESRSRVGDPKGNDLVETAQAV